MRWRSAADALARDEGGSVAAEFAIAMPAVLLVLATGLGGIAVVAQQLTLQDAAADAARMLGRGDAPDRVEAMVTGRAAGATLVARRPDPLVCVRLTLEARIGPLPIPVSAHGCALDGG